MTEENKENPTVKNNPVINDLLMKPFSLGWTREVVKRLVTNSKTPNCDIYYLSPNKKRLRSLTEVKYNLTDGLSPECFSFKREPLGLSPDLETIRDAKARGKGAEKSKENKRTSSVTRKQNKSEDAKVKDEDNENEAKKKKTETEIKETLKPDPEVVENEEKLDGNNSSKNSEVKNESEKMPEIKSETKAEMKPRRAKSNVKQSDETKTFNSDKKIKTKTRSAKPAKSVKLQSVKKRKTVLKKVMSAKRAKQAKLVVSRKVLKKIVRKKVASIKRKLTKTQVDKKSALKTKKKNSLQLKAGKKPLKNSLKKTKKESAKEPENNETDKKSATRDLKSIVKKNIVKYREMREKQKLGVVKAQGRSSTKKIPVPKVSRSRLEPISKNRHIYIKPLEKGWRRELVFRSNCAKAGQQADVYYFHPSGKKLRSFREVSENLTHGLSIECFTFRKEAIGCGEPSEVIRNARCNQKN